MKLLITFLLSLASFAGFSQARELLARDTANHRPGLIMYDTAKTLNIDTTLKIISQSPYQVTLGVNPNVLSSGSYWANNALFPQKIHNTNTWNVGIGTDTAWAKLHVLSAMAANTINDTSGIMISNSNAATSGNQIYSPSLILKGYGWKSTGASSVPSMIRTYVVPVQASIWPLANQNWDVYNSDGLWYNLMKLQSFNLGGSPIYGGLSLGNININTTQNQIDGNSGGLIFSVNNGNANIKLTNSSATNLFVRNNGSLWQQNNKNGIALNDAVSAQYADSSAMVDISSPLYAKGLLIPRTTSSQRDSITSAIQAWNTVTITNGGSGYVTGSYTVPMTGGSGSGGKLSLTVSGGIVTASNNNTNFRGGTGYVAGDVLSASNTSLGGTGSGLVVTVNKVGAYAVNVPKGLIVQDTSINQMSIHDTLNNWEGRVFNNTLSAMNLWYGDDYIFTGTTATYTLPAIGGNYQGSQNGIKIINLGSGSITLNSASGSQIIPTASTTAQASLTVTTGQSVQLFPTSNAFKVLSQN